MHISQQGNALKVLLIIRDILITQVLHKHLAK